VGVAGNVEAFGAEQGEDATGVDSGHEAALMVEPQGVALCRSSVTDEGEAGGAEGDELVGIDGEIGGGFRAKGGV
jgi:hypothetical protein